jgi:hypothetical protein
MFSKSYKVILEYIKINIVSEKIDWINKNISVNSNSENIIINIQRLENIIVKSNKSLLPNLIINNKAITYNDIIHYWNYNCALENTSLKINEDYFIAPCYIIDGLLIIGIIIFNTRKELYKILETYNYLSTIKSLDDTNEFNIINGILNYRISCSGKIKLLGKEILGNKYLKIKLHHEKELLIKWEYIFRNIANYLPKFKITYKSNKNIITNFFQNRLNP